ASGILAPYFLPADFVARSGTAAERRQSKLLLQYLHEFYLAYGPRVIEGYRQLVAQVLKYRPGLLRGMPKFDYEFYDVGDEDISLKQCGQDSYVLNALASSWNMTAQVKRSKWFLKTFSCYLASGLDPMDCQGTREQLTDFCLLRLRAENTNSQHAAVLIKLLARVTGQTERASYEELL